MIIAIVGPTGVGKTKLSIELAKRYNAIIINADSMQVYKGLDIGTAKITEEEKENIPHYLFDIREPNEEYSVYDYQIDCRKAIEDITSRNKRVIIVGGTGLYIKAALYDYKFTKGTTNNKYEELTNEEILDKISSYDLYLSTKLELNNRQRLVRVLNKLENKEVFTNNKDKLLYPVKVIGLTTDRDYLYERINKRVDNMMNNGLLDEINSLKEKYPNSRILNSGIGYKEFYDYLFNSKDLESVIESIKQDSRRFAKRQFTFFNHQFDTKWITVDFNNFNNTIEEVLNYIKK